MLAHDMLHVLKCLQISGTVRRDKHVKIRMQIWFLNMHPFFDRLLVQLPELLLLYRTQRAIPIWPQVSFTSPFFVLHTWAAGLLLM